MATFSRGRSNPDSGPAPCLVGRCIRALRHHGPGHVVQNARIETAHAEGADATCVRCSLSSHATLQQHVRTHLGQSPSLTPVLKQFLEAVHAGFCEIETPPEVPAHETAPRLCPGTVFQALQCGVLVRAADGEIIEHNSAAERLLGLSFEQLRGLAPLDPAWRLIHPNGDGFPIDQTPARLTLRDGKPRQGVILGVAVSDGVVRWFSCNADPLRGPDGNLFAAVASFFDVTEIALQIPEVGASPVAPPAATQAATPRPTLGAIARQLDVSIATVSMALRNHPRISEETREKVKLAAHELGYRVDPHVQRAMLRIRQGKQAAAKANLCALGALSSFADPFVAALISAARLRADQLGYGFSVEWLDRTQADPARLTRTLVHRGVDGVLLLPRNTPWVCDDLLAWSRFSVVAIGHCVTSPDFDRVAVDWFSTIRGAGAELAARGYRRIGAVIDSRLDELSGHRIEAALASIHLHLPLEPASVFHYRTVDGQMLVADPRNAPLAAAAEPTPHGSTFPALWQEFCRRLQDWHRREQPDALVIDGESTAMAVQKALALGAPAHLGIVVLNRRPNSQFAGWEERPVKIGEGAIELLDNKVRHAERGAPAAPSVKAIKGSWHDGPSVRPRPEVENGGTVAGALFPAPRK